MGEAKEITILVVDDDPDMRRLLEVRLPQLGYSVTTASSGDEAISLIWQVNPQIVLLDQEMPGSDGLNSFLDIRNTWPDLPVVMCTGHGSIELVRVFMLKGGQDFIQKPILDLETLDFRLRKVLRDFEKERKAREELIAAREKVDAEAFKSMILASISHELRTPLNHLMGFSQMLAAGVEQPVEISQKIIEAADRLSGLVDKIMAAATLEGNPVISVLSLPDLIQELIVYFEWQIKTKGLILKTDVPALSVSADYRKLRKVLSNLIENAIKFTESGGAIKISAFGDGVRMVISVADSGIGIAEKDLKGIFERFGKVDHKTGERPGMGMGLYAAKKLVDLMGGKLDVTSEPGKGSIFTVTL
ncbi:MAG: hybrid sensor histidine kinase/response regulator [Nitrospirae bacterium]|nr:hybrid sensor histidine kinase/response regulator [Nitrospirota bacterium]